MGYRTGEQMKRVLCLVLAAIMAFNVGVTNVSAKEREDCKPDKREWRQEDYERLNQTLNYLGYDENDKIYYTELMQTQNKEDNVKYVSFVYDDERAIGQYVLEENGEKTDECFIINKDSEILNGLVTHMTGEVFEIEEEVLEEVASDLEAENKSWEKLSESAAKYLTGFAPQGAFIRIGYISNSNNPTTGSGLCWAACGAAIVNYYYNYSYDALSMYEYVRRRTGGIPVGNVSYQRGMFDMFGLNYDYTNGRLTFEQVITCIKKGSVVKYSLQRDGGAHATILCGAFRISDSYGFIYMDPNVSGGYVLNYNPKDIATSNGKDFYYWNGQQQYTWIYGTFYNFSK